MTNEEAGALCLRAQAGDTDARDELVLAHRDLAKMVAWDWVRTLNSLDSVDAADLAADCLLVLLGRVIPEFDPGYGVPFRARARGQMRDHLSNRHRYLLRRDGDWLSRVRKAVTEQRSSNNDPHLQYEPGDLDRLLQEAESSGLLNQQQVTALQLRGHGMPWAQVAARMNRKEQTCRQYYCTARAVLTKEREWNS